MKNISKGFTLIETLLVILIVAVIGFGGYYIMQSHHPEKPTASIENNKHASTQAAKPIVSQKYLVITEWGVKLPLGSSINDAYYVASTSSHDGQGRPNTMWLGVKSLDGQPGCDAHTANEGRGVSIGSIIRTGPGEVDPRTGETFDPTQPNGQKIGNNYYSVLLAQADCTQDPQYGTLLTSVRNAFSQAGQHINTQ